MRQIIHPFNKTKHFVTIFQMPSEQHFTEQFYPMKWNQYHRLIFQFKVHLSELHKWKEKRISLLDASIEENKVKINWKTSTTERKYNPNVIKVNWTNNQNRQNQKTCRKILRAAVLCIFFYVQIENRNWILIYFWHSTWTKNSS